MGRYITAADLYAEFGTQNVQKWATLDGSNDYATAIEAAIVDAEATLDDELRGGPYIVPLGGGLDGVVKRIVRGMAMDVLYRNRGVTEEVDDLMEPRRKVTRELLVKVQTGQIRLQAARVGLGGGECISL
jgi:phage gp36-like protein